MPKAFICSSFPAQSEAIQISCILNDNGITTIRLDHEPSFSTNISDTISRKIDSCEIFVFLFSKNTSQNLLFELGIAKAKQKSIIIIALDDTFLPSDLLGQEYIRLTENTVAGWLELEKSLKTILKKLRLTESEEEESTSHIGNNFTSAEPNVHLNSDDDDTRHIKEREDSISSISTDFTNSEPKVFISHDSDDFARVDKFRRILESRGVPCWIAPRNIPFGSNYAREIPSAIKNCKCVLVFVSKRSQTSENIEKEIEIAVNYQKRIIPIRLENCEFEGPYMYHLQNKQWFNAYNSNEDYIEKLIRDIGSYEFQGHTPSHQEQPGISVWFYILPTIAAILLFTIMEKNYVVLEVNEILKVIVILLIPVVIKITDILYKKIKERN